MKIETIDVDMANTLDFSQVDAIAQDYINKHTFDETVYDITDIRYGLIRVSNEEDDSYQLLPAWYYLTEGSEYTVDADLVLIAAGFLGSQDYVTKAFGVEVNERTNVKTEAGKYSTNVKDVFTAGDMHRGQSLVVWAIREGREVAREVDESLMGYTNLYIQ